MPSINKLRVSNVLFDNNSRFYDDIVIPVNEGRLLIEAENGSGKTLLMQCILQSVKPMLYFHRKNAEHSEQPTIRNLFRSNQNTTMHSMIEWTLDEDNKYDYMITGFCARKVQKETEEGKVSDIEYFNYVIIYNADMPFSVESIPLRTVKNGASERMSSSQLQKFLKDLHRDKRLLVKRFDSNREYESFLNTYNINSSEFELMRNINLKEGGSEEYFTEHYKTPYDFIVGELVDRIESVNKMRLQTAFKSEIDLANSLFEIKTTMDKLKHQQEKKDEIAVAEIYFNRLIEVNERLINELENKSNIFTEIAKGFNTQIALIEEMNEKIQLANLEKEIKTLEQDEVTNNSEENDNAILQLEEQIKVFNLELDKVKELREILQKRAEKKELLEKVEQCTIELEAINKSINNIEETSRVINENILAVKREEEIRNNENIYVEYLDAMKTLKSNEKKYELIHKDLEAIIQEELKTQGYLLYAFNQEIELLENEVVKIDENINLTKDEISGITNSIQENTVNINTNKNILKENDNKKEENEKNKREKEETLNSQISTLDSLNKEKLTVISEVKTKAANIDIPKVDTDSLDNDINSLEHSLKENAEVNDTINNMHKVNSTIADIQTSIMTIQDDIKSNISIKSDKIIELENLDIQSEYDIKLKPIQDSVTKLEEEKSAYKKEIEDIDRIICNTYTAISNIEDALAAYYNDLEELPLIAKKYSIEDRFELEVELSKEADSTKKELFRVEEIIEKTSETIEELEKNKGILVPEDTKKCYEILSKAYASTYQGMNFNESLTLDEKEKYLGLSNLIPVGIILNNTDYNSLLKNRTLLEKIDDYLVPIINIDRIKKGEGQGNEVVYISSKDKDFYIDEEKRKLQIEKLKKDLEKLNKEDAIISENLSLISKDLSVVSKINNRYTDKNFEANQKEHIKDLHSEIKMYQKEIEDYKRKIAEIDEKVVSNKETISILTIEMNDKIESLKKQIQDLNREIQLLNTENNSLSDSSKNLAVIETIIQKLDTIISKESSTKVIISNLKDDINKAISEIDELLKENFELEKKNKTLEEENNKLQIQLTSLNAKLEGFNSDKINVSAKKRGFTDELERGELIKVDINPIANTNSINNLRNELRVIRNNKNSQNSDIEILEENIQSYKRIAINKKADINTAVISFEELESRKNSITKNERNVFEDIAKREKKLQVELQNNREKLDKEKESRTECKTIKEQALNRARSINTSEEVIIPEDYNPDKEENRYKEELSNVENVRKDKIKNRTAFIKQLKTIANEISKIEEEIHSNDKELTKLISTKSSIEHIMRTNNIKEDKTLGTLENRFVSIYRYEKSLEQHSKSFKELANRHSELRIECLDRLKDTAFSIVTILESIEPKNDIAEVKTQNIIIKDDCLKILDQIRENLDIELQQLVELKDNFVEKCLERTDNLLNKIKKLQKLVTIEHEGTKRPLIKVNLNELEASRKKEKMYLHIENTLKQINTDLDSEENKVQTERISKMLSSSKLLEQVIINPKRCEVKIYVPKNETNVVANGSYVNWGGTASGGQRNVMYFTVTIALLLFIRELSTVGTTSKQSKVLYVDGAFKASASIYLWECICPLLVDNNIQLVVTNMGTPSPLMKMFDSVALLRGYKKQIGNNFMIENKIGQNSIFKSDQRTLKTDNILHNFGEYRIPKKETIIEKEEVYQQDLLSLL